MQAFLGHGIPFGGIVRLVEDALGSVPEAGAELDALLEADRLAREYVGQHAGTVRR